jgi:hypothetical protein
VLGGWWHGVGGRGRWNASASTQHKFNRQQVALNAQQREINADVRTTLTRLATRIVRLIPTGENGRDA